MRRPRQIASEVIAIAAGGNHTVYLTADRKLWGLGDNTAGQLGIAPATKSSATPVEIASDVTAVSAGALHTVFIKSDRTLWSAGNDAMNPSTFDRAAQVATEVVAAAAGQRFTLFLKSDRSLWGVGSNESGALGLAAIELAPRQITVNVVAPGATDTPMLKDPKRAAVAPKMPPMGRLVKPEEVAATVCFLLSEGAASITGQQILVCGGASL